MIDKKEIDKLKKMFENNIENVVETRKNRAFITIKPKSLLDIADYLFYSLKYRFVIATALESKTGIEIYYHFSDDNSGTIINLHVILSKRKPEIESLTCKFEAANWIEREMHELYGINFLNHPNLEKLISEGNWAEGVFPYREN